MSYMESGQVTPDLRDKIPLLLVQPYAPSIQLQHIQLLKQIKYRKITSRLLRCLTVIAVEQRQPHEPHTHLLPFQRSLYHPVGVLGEPLKTPRKCATAT